MGWVRVELAGTLGEHTASWDELNERYYRGHPFFDSRFVEALLKHMGSGTECLFIHRAHQQIDGMVILRPRSAGVWTQFSPSQAQCLPVLVKTWEDLVSLFEALPGQVWAYELLKQDPDFLPAGDMSSFSLSRTTPHALTINVSLSSDFDTYWNSRSRNLIKNMRRYERRVIDSFGAPKLTIISERDLLQSAVARYGDIESKGWKGVQGTAIHATNVQGRFYEEVFRAYGMTNQATVYEYWFGDMLAASRLVIHTSEMAIILKTAYDESLSQFAPGRLLLKAVLEHMFENRLSRSVEFYTDASEDQLAWATGQRRIFHVMRFRSTGAAKTYETLRSIKAKWVAAKSCLLSSRPRAEPLVGELKFVGCSELDASAAKLFDGPARDSFDLSLPWYALLEAAATPSGQSMVMESLHRNGKAIAVLPWLILARRGGAVLRSPTTFYSSLYRPILSEEATQADLVFMLRQAIERFGVGWVRLDLMAVEDPIFARMEDALGCIGLKVHRHFCHGNWYLPVNGRSYEQYFQGLSSQVRHTVLRRRRKFFAEGRGTLSLFTQVDDIDAAIRDWNAIYGASWKKPEPFTGFMPGLIQLCAEKGWLRMGLAKLDGIPIAAQIWIVNGGRASIYKLAYDERYARYSAGTLLTDFLMRQALDVDRVQEVDYLVGDDRYKKDWMSHRRERWGMVAYNPRRVMGLYGLGREYAIRALKGTCKPTKTLLPKGMKPD